jgi:hypothetical protein
VVSVSLPNFSFLSWFGWSLQVCQISAFCLCVGGLCKSAKFQLSVLVWVVSVSLPNFSFLSWFGWSLQVCQISAFYLIKNWVNCFGQTYKRRYHLPFQTPRGNIFQVSDFPFHFDGSSISIPNFSFLHNLELI